MGSDKSKDLSLSRSLKFLKKLHASLVHDGWLALGDLQFQSKNSDRIAKMTFKNPDCTREIKVHWTRNFEKISETQFSFKNIFKETLLKIEGESLISTLNLNRWLDISMTPTLSTYPEIEYCRYGHLEENFQTVLNNDSKIPINLLAKSLLPLHKNQVKGINTFAYKLSELAQDSGASFINCRVQTDGVTLGASWSFETSDARVAKETCILFHNLCPREMAALFATYDSHTIKMTMMGPSSPTAVTAGFLFSWSQTKEEIKLASVKEVG